MDFSLSPYYSSLKEGVNKITAKFSCDNNPNLVSYDSVNLVGLVEKQQPSIAQPQITIGNFGSSPPPISDTPTPPPNNNNTTTPIPTPPPNNNNTTTPIPTPPPNNRANNPLAVSIAVAKDPITVGDVQTITVTVTDADSNKLLQGITIHGEIMYASGTVIKQFAGTTDNSGEVSHSWTIEGDANPGVFTVTIKASSLDYNPESARTSFEVSPGDDIGNASSVTN